MVIYDKFVGNDYGKNIYIICPSNIVKYGKLLENTWDGDGEVAWR